MKLSSINQNYNNTLSFYGLYGSQNTTVCGGNNGVVLYKTTDYYPFQGEAGEKIEEKVKLKTKFYIKGEGDIRKQYLHTVCVREPLNFSEADYRFYKSKNIENPQFKETAKKVEKELFERDLCKYINNHYKSALYTTVNYLKRVFR